MLEYKQRYKALVEREEENYVKQYLRGIRQLFCLNSIKTGQVHSVNGRKETWPASKKSVYASNISQRNHVSQL